MNHSFSKIILFILITTGFFLTFFSTAQTFTPNLQSVIKQLQDQINLLNQQITDLQNRLEKTEEEVEIVKSELKLTRSLKRGESGDQVKQLQEFLKQFPDIYPEGIITGFFGELTERAVKKFQERQGIVSSGTAETTGYGRIGPKTIQKLNEFSISATQATPAIPAVPGVFPALPAIPAIPASPSLPLVVSTPLAQPATASASIPVPASISFSPSISTSSTPSTSTPSTSTSAPLTISPITSPTPTPNLSKPSVVSFTGNDGTWCYDSDGLRGWFTKGYCQDNTGTYYDNCYAGYDNIANDYSCGVYQIYNSQGKPSGNTTRCVRDGWTCSGSLGNVCSDGICVNTSTNSTVDKSGPLITGLSISPTSGPPKTTITFSVTAEDSDGITNIIYHIRYPNDGRFDSVYYLKPNCNFGGAKSKTCIFSEPIDQATQPQLYGQFIIDYISAADSLGNIAVYYPGGSVSNSTQTSHSLTIPVITIISSTPTPTPTPTPTTSFQYTMQGIDGTWCIDGDYGTSTPDGSWGPVYIKSSCQDQSGTYYDYCDGSGNVHDWGCVGTWDGASRKSVKCNESAYQVSGTSYGNRGYVCSDGGLIISSSTPTPTPTPISTPAPTGSVSFSPLNQASATANILDALKAVLRNLNNLLIQLNW